MSDEKLTAAEAAPPVPGVPPGLAAIADHWGLVLAYGLVSLGLGVTLAVWPDETLTVVAILIGVQFLVSGVVRVVGAIAASSVETAVRVLYAVTGALAVIVGLLCLRDPLQTLVAITIILGVWWVASGVIDIIGAVIAPVAGRRAWDLFSGGISVLAGGYLLVDPTVSLGLLVLVVCLWLIVTGLIGIVAALRLRARRAPATSGATPAAPPPAPAV